ncbi:MAG: hypothetical protein HGA80_01180 [Candidatus Omnitrophica bacterium]|nr:hypothetical protein [Candidatus Omnitrophota bacterium]
MKINKTLLKLSFLALFVGAFLYAPTQAHAWFGHDRHSGPSYRHHDRYPYGSISIGLPHGFLEFGFGGRRYFYNAGLFYLQDRTQYVVVPPPTGAVIYQIPSGWHTVVIDGVTYYVYNGVYYTRIPQGYQVVQPPAPVIVEPATVAANIVPDQSQSQPQQEFAINIPNNKGGYVTVVIKRSGTGFVGPQGEFYEEFPKVTQLQVMYAK